MSRPLRLEFHGALYHLTARGDGREDIFLDDADRTVFLGVLAQVTEQFNWTVHAYCLMSNPVRACMVHRAQEWPWSSYRATAGLADAPDWLSTDWVLSAFSVRRDLAVQRYEAFVSEGCNQPGVWEQLKNQIYLGSDAFVQEMLATKPAKQDLSEIPLPQRRKPAKPLKQYEQQATNRDEAMALAYARGGYGLKEIGEHFGVHYSRVSRIVRRAGEQ